MPELIFDIGELPPRQNYYRNDDNGKPDMGQCKFAGDREFHTLPIVVYREYLYEKLPSPLATLLTGMPGPTSCGSTARTVQAPVPSLPDCARSERVPPSAAGTPAGMLHVS